MDALYKKRLIHQQTGDVSVCNWNSPLNLMSAYDRASMQKVIYGDRYVPLSINQPAVSLLPCVGKKRKHSESALGGHLGLLDALFPDNQSKILRYKKISINTISHDSKLPKLDNSVSQLMSPQQMISDHVTIEKKAFRVLNAHDLADDFYLNLIDWSIHNTLVTALGNSVYLGHNISICTNRTIRLHAFLPLDRPTAVAWNEQGNHLAVGTHRGNISIWDPVTLKAIFTVHSHGERVGVFAWNDRVLASGSRDRTKNVVLRDIREPSYNKPFAKLTRHSQEVCGLRWSPDKNFLATGGNDNLALVWTTHSLREPLLEYPHLGAVKALSWSPHHHGLLATGGGTMDKTIKFRNVITERNLSEINVGSQVTNLAWSSHSSQLVSTHGYSDGCQTHLNNNIVVWNYPSAKRVAILNGHDARVLYLAKGPDNVSIATGAGDETIRLWCVFPKRQFIGTKQFSAYQLNHLIR